ncbi:competence protein ComK [Gracilibacillus caseinilyticus]|uniref:Competence protein ComK n=1 Tax=Gracilibacillus caseinilyticus TaxID=2932256 RepID=A0ABY4ESN7_9BACI|nr:competence protein ComK [Gracilibacillus caseinilyticus]UOQ46878.1 competence protein ComK [Gracilibacillus caseinilyticus]
MEMLMEKVREISPKTLAIVGKEEGGQYFTRVIEYDEADDYETTWSTQKVLDYTCREFGISLRGLIEGSRMLSKITHKPPIAIDRISGMYFFPIESPQRKACTWIAHSHVLELEKVDHDLTRIVFKNGRDLILDVSYATMINQLYRTAQYRYLLSNKMEQILESAQFVAEAKWHKH